MRVHPIVFVIGFALAAPAFSQAAPRAEQPDVQPGDAWVYEHTTFPGESKRQFTVRVREVTPDTIVTGQPANGSVFSRDWALRETKRAGEATFRAEPGRALLQFPMDVGKRWDGNNTATLPNGQQRWQGQASVEKVEKVTVPAGTFDAYVIRYEGYYNTVDGRANVRWLESIWYVPEARRWVKRDWTWRTQRPHYGTYTERQTEELVSMSRKTPEAKPSDSAVQQ